jgi:hypothetical protein
MLTRTNEFLTNELIGKLKLDILTPLLDTLVPLVLLVLLAQLLSPVEQRELMAMLALLPIRRRVSSLIPTPGFL